MLYPAVGALFWFVRSEDSNRATAPQRRAQQSSGLLGSPRESPRCVVGRKNLTGATRCTIPFGAGSAFTRALRFASRGPVAKNAPPERF